MTNIAATRYLDYLIYLVFADVRVAVIVSAVAMNLRHLPQL